MIGVKTTHEIYFKDARDLGEIRDETIDLVVTSPPYPMIGMWDAVFASLNERIREVIQQGEGRKAFKLMHKELNKVWQEIERVLKPGGIACINIGDATRNVGNCFQLYPNHVLITDFFQENDFSVLPSILWRKQTNVPNKFMGSGMIPPNAYVTLEHEYILLFRKGSGTRDFKPKAEHRYESAYFWEERNKWFSDVWENIKGVPQELNDDTLREKAAAFPLALPYRLINMFSVYGDTVLDPFWGTGTTSIAAMASSRNSFGYEIDSNFMRVFRDDLREIKKITNTVNARRIRQHIEFVKKRKKEEKEPKYQASNYDFKVMTKQETNILFRTIKEIKRDDNRFIVKHEKFESDMGQNSFQVKLVP